MVKFVGKQSIPVVLKLFLLADPFCFFKITADPNNFQNIDIVKKNNTEHLFQYHIHCKLDITLNGKDVLATQHIAFFILGCVRETASLM